MERPASAPNVPFMPEIPVSQRVKIPVPHVGGTTYDDGLPQPSRHDGDGHDPRLKKIYVYADNVWSSHAAAETRIVRIQTPAFDLSGWIDFTEARQQDQFIVEVRVFMAHASNVLCQRSGFQGNMLAMMRHITGADTISGNHIEITIQQTYSLDNFATPVPVPYQFVVESQ